MVGELIMLPVRVGVRATQLWLRAAEETISVASGATSRLVGLAAARASGGNGGTATAPRPDTERHRQAEPGAADTPPPAEGREPEPRDSVPEPDDREIARAASAALEREPAAPSEAPSPPSEPEPVHVSEEPALVEEVAEPGAEDGAGAEIHIEAPWDGYARMNAKEIISRLGESTPAELAAVQLYESSHRKRQTILNAVQRELRSANGRSG